jgi:hypothetical protein
MRYPSPQQFELDLKTLYFKFASTPMRDEILQQLADCFVSLYKSAGATQRPNEAYSTYLSCCFDALQAFHKAAPPSLFIEDTPTSFRYYELLHLEDASAAMAAAFGAQQSNFRRLGMFTRFEEEPFQRYDFHYPEPIFREREPVDGDMYDKRNYREAKEDFKRYELRPWEEHKKEYEADIKRRIKQREDTTTRLMRAFSGTPLFDRTYSLPVKSHPTSTPFRVQFRPPQVGLERAYPCSA